MFEVPTSLVYSTSMAVDACKSSEQPLLLASEEGRFRFSGMWFEDPQSVIVFSPAHGKLLLRCPTRDSQAD